MESRIKQIISDIIDVEETEIHDNFGPEDASLWDSMNNLRLITAIEEEFQIKISMEDIKRMTNFNHIKMMIACYLNNS